MDFIQGLKQRLPTNPTIPTYDDISKTAEKISPRLGFLNRRIRLRRNSKISIPLGVILVFPVVLVIIILVLVLRHPDSHGGNMMQAGAPPVVR